MEGSGGGLLPAVGDVAKVKVMVMGEHREENKKYTISLRRRRKLVTALLGAAGTQVHVHGRG